MKNWVDITAVVGTKKIPRGAAFVIQTAMKEAIKNGDVGERNKWQIIEFWAAEYLAGSK